MGQAPVQPGRNANNEKITKPALMAAKSPGMKSEIGRLLITVRIGQAPALHITGDGGDAVYPRSRSLSNTWNIGSATAAFSSPEMAVCWRSKRICCPSRALASTQ